MEMGSTNTTWEPDPLDGRAGSKISSNRSFGVILSETISILTPWLPGSYILLTRDIAPAPVMLINSVQTRCIAV